MPNCSSILEMAVLRAKQGMLQAQHRGESPGRRAMATFKVSGLDLAIFLLANCASLVRVKS